jgi:hypothetical protein
MKIKLFLLIIIVAITIITLTEGFKTPPDEIYGFELNEFDKIKFRVNDSIIDLNSDEIEFWKTLTFKKAENEYPGETPDFNVNLVGLKTHYSAIYNHSSPIVFFSFLPDCKYGYFNAPPPGGWTKPLYYTNATDSLLKLLKYKKIKTCHNN